MAKQADRYFRVHPWKIIEEGFSEAHSRLSESIFSLGNEYMGVRGYFDEGYSGESLVGSYLNGVFEEEHLARSAYIGMVDRTTFMVNAVDWLYLRIECEGEALDIYKSQVSDFRRELDLATGVLTRSFTWKTASGRALAMEFERFLSMDEPRFGGQRLRVRADENGELHIKAGLDLSPVHNSAGGNMWDCLLSESGANQCRIAGRTKVSGQMIYSACRFDGEFMGARPLPGDKKALLSFILPLKSGAWAQLTRTVQNLKCTDAAMPADAFIAEGMVQSQALDQRSYDALKQGASDWWADTWARSDIEIAGDDVNQQGIRFCIFQMHQTYHGAEPGTAIGAKGLTGEAYNGNTFWDTEAYCLPFYLFNNPQAARNLLLFRYRTLPQAKERARELDCAGAFYPVATIDGTESCALWQHASLQLQASTAVTYGVWHYVKITGDTDFLYGYGAEMIAEVCRMLATRGDWNGAGQYGYYGVMGPDEFQMMVNHNCYTNYMAKAAFEYALTVMKQMKAKAPEKYAALAEKIALDEKELKDWRRMAAHMYIPYDAKSKIFEQHEDYFKLPHIEVDKIPLEDFPLYHHWTYDRIYRNDMIKQPDVLMLMFLYNARFTEAQKRKNYEYYEPRCIHESSLSPSVHSILASELKKHDLAYRFFGFATRMDLDNYNRNTAEGLHTTSIAAAWMNIVYGFGGMRSDGEMLGFSPSIPKGWERYAFHVVYADDVIAAEVGRERVRFHSCEKDIPIKVYGKDIVITKGGVEVKIPSEWRG
jgi:maltose phosphorylase